MLTENSSKFVLGYYNWNNISTKTTWKNNRKIRSVFGIFAGVFVNYPNLSLKEIIAYCPLYLNQCHMENKKKIGIPAVGTWGDVAPMIQLATRLRVEGHQIIIGSTSRYAQPIKEQGKPQKIILSNKLVNLIFL